MSRLEKLDPQSLDPTQAELYDAIARGPRASGPQLFRLVDEHGRLEGPFNAMLLSPPLGTALQHLGAAVRYRSTLSDRAREMAILVVAAAWESDFEWYAHEAVGRSFGLGDDELAAISRGNCPESLGDVESAVVETAQALVASGDLTDEQYRVAKERLGESRLFELSTLVGYYATLALQLRIFRVPAPTA